LPAQEEVPATMRAFIPGSLHDPSGRWEVSTGRHVTFRPPDVHLLFELR